MILGGKLPGKVGRCRFLFCKLFLQYRGKIAVMLSFFLLATSLLSERMVSFDPLCGIAARKETMKLAGLRLRVIWTLPVFSYLNLGKIERKNWARSVKRMRASFLLPWFTHDRDKKLRVGARTLRHAPFYYIENIAEQYSYITTKVPCEAALIHERHMRIEISDFVMRTFVSIAIQNEDSICCLFFFWQRLYFPKGWFCVF